MKVNALSSILIYRNIYRRERLYFLRRVFFAVLALTLLSFWVNVVLIGREPEHWYVPVAKNGVAAEIRPLHMKVKQDDEVVRWAAAATERAYRMDFVNYRRDLQEIRQLMTKAGWNSYAEDLQNGSQNFRLMKSHKLASKLEVLGEGKIRRQDVFNGVYTWRIDYPVRLTYESSEVKREIEADMSIVVVQQPVHINIDGLGIAQITARRSGTSRLP